MAVVVARAGVLREHGAAAQFEDAVEAREVGRIVRRHQDRERVALVEEEALDDLAARRVERGVGLIEQQHFGALHEGAGDERALQLAAGKRVHRSVGQCRQAQLREGLVDGGFAVAAFLEPSVVRVRPHLHQPAEEERKTFRQLGALREIGDPAATQRGRRAGDEDFAGLRRDESGEDAAEVDLLIGDATKAKKQLGWVPKVKFKELTEIMVDADIEQLAEERAGKRIRD